MNTGTNEGTQPTALIKALQSQAIVDYRRAKNIVRSMPTAHAMDDLNAYLAEEGSDLQLFQAKAYVIGRHLQEMVRAQAAPIYLPAFLQAVLVVIEDALEAGLSRREAQALVIRFLKEA
jgi:hypothetical protein